MERQPLFETLQKLLQLPPGPLNATLSRVADLISEAFHTEKVDAFLYQPQHDSLIAVGTSDTPLGRRQRALGLHRLPIANGGRCVQVYQTGRSFRSGRAEKDPEELLGIREALGIRSTLAVPLRVGGTLRGVLALTTTKSDAYSDEEQRFLEIVTEWVGTVAHRSELIEELTLRAGEQGRRAGADELVMTLAHDLSNLLLPLSARIELLLGRAMRENRAPDVRDATSAGEVVRRLTRLVTDLLDVSRIDEGVFTLRAQRFDLAELVTQTALALSPPESAITVEGDASAPVDADPDRVRQVLENLIGNAVKHSPRGVPVSVRLENKRLEDGRVWTVVEVNDQGPGIPPELMPKLFDRMVRGGRAQGLGLGLYIAHRIVAAHGGTLTADSSPSGGARFVFALPPAENAAAAPGDREADAAGEPGTH